MSRISKLIADGKEDKAAEILYDTLYNVLKVGNDITRSEFATVAPKLVEKLQNPTPATAGKTDAPGDDIEVKKVGVLKVTLKGEGLQTKVVNQKYTVGTEYKYTVPTVKGYKADKTELTGTMDENGKEEAVTYTVEVAASTGTKTSGNTKTSTGTESSTGNTNVGTGSTSSDTSAAANKK